MTALALFQKGANSAQNRVPSPDVVLGLERSSRFHAAGGRVGLCLAINPGFQEVEDVLLDRWVGFNFRHPFSQVLQRLGPSGPGGHGLAHHHVVVVFILRSADWTLVMRPLFPSLHLSAASEMTGCKFEDESVFPQWSLLLGSLHCLSVERVPLVVGDGVAVLGLPVISGCFVVDELVDSCFGERGKFLPSDPQSPSFVMQLEVRRKSAFWGGT